MFCLKMETFIQALHGWIDESVTPMPYMSEVMINLEATRGEKEEGLLQHLDLQCPGLPLNPYKQTNQFLFPGFAPKNHLPSYPYLEN
jgi:hypothetical protein